MYWPQPILPGAGERAETRRAIQLVAKAMEDNFGLKPKVGGELEFYVFGKDRDNTDPLGYQGVQEIGEAYGKLTRAIEQTEGRSKRYGKLPLVGEFYKERTKHKYEFNMVPADPLTTADGIEKLKRSIVDMAPRYGIEEVSFHATEEKISPSLHTTLSFASAKSPNIFCDRFGFPSPIFPHIAENMLDVLAETVLLAAPQVTSYGRYASSYVTTPTKISVDDNNKILGSAVLLRSYHDAPTLKDDFSTENRWIENRIPGDADPYEAVLSTLVAAYVGLERSVKRGATGQIAWDEDGIPLHNERRPGPVSYPLPRTLEGAHAKFEKGTLFKATLDKLSGDEKLGTKLHGEILARYEGRDLSPPYSPRDDFGIW